MMFPFQFEDQYFNIQAERAEETKQGLILHGAQAHVNLPAPPLSYYRHGWQSWSLATWQDPNFKLPALKPAILHPLQTDPLYVQHPAPNGSWLGAVELENGKILLLGALGLETHVAFHDQQSHGEAARLHGWYEAGSGDWYVGYGDETTVFARYAELLGERLGKAPGKPTPSIWCSWYSLYSAISEKLLLRVFDSLADLPFDVIQVDDGWQVSVGDWEANEKFPSGMQALAARIRASGRTPGLWLAPLTVVRSSSIYRQHRDWLLRGADGNLVSAGFNWGEPLYALDTTRPEMSDWLKALMKQVRTWGFDYLKMDFLYAGALPGKRYVDLPREAAYRQALEVLRTAMGVDAYFLACGAPILPSLGKCDALRVGPDVAGTWENHRDAVLLYNPTTPGTRNAIRTTLNRLWLSSLVTIDPDVAYFSAQNHSLTEQQRRLLQDLALLCNYKATSDLPQWMDTEELQQLRAFLNSDPQAERTGRTSFKIDGREVDFKMAVSLPQLPTGLDALLSIAVGWVSNQGWVLKLFDQQWKRNLQKKLKKLNQTNI